VTAIRTHGPPSAPQDSGTFRFPSGADLADIERALLIELLAARTLAGALCRRERFRTDARIVSRAEEPSAIAHEISLRYCQGKRRRVIQRLLLRAAQATLIDQPLSASRLVGARATFTVDQEGRHHRYAIGPASMVPLVRASHLVAARGAGECLGWRLDGSPCPQRAAAGSVYCRRHDGDASIAAWESERDTILRRLFNLAAPAVLDGATDLDE
jgi:hypothetical protein